MPNGSTFYKDDNDGIDHSPMSKPSLFNKHILLAFEINSVYAAKYQSIVLLDRIQELQTPILMLLLQELHRKLLSAGLHGVHWPQPDAGQAARART